MYKRLPLTIGCCVYVFLSPPLIADSGADLARQLANPVASLISVPIDVDFDSDLGPDERGDQSGLGSSSPCARRQGRPRFDCQKDMP